MSASAPKRQATITSAAATPTIPSTTSTALVAIGLWRRPNRRPRRERGLLDFSAHVAGVELVHVELAVEAEVLGVGTQEALDVGLRREEVELLLLERAQVLAADLGRLLDLAESRVPGAVRLTEAVADLEHGVVDCRRS